MNGHKVTAHLEWWVNPSTCLACVPVSVTVTPCGWDATASPAFDHDVREDVQLLIDASPVFTLRFQDGSVTEVAAEHSGDVNQLRLSTSTNPDPDT